MTRPEFAEVAGYFRATGWVERAMLLAAAGRFARSVLAGGVDVDLADALVPFVPSLLAVGCSDQAVCGFVADLTGRLAPVRPVLLFLDGDAGTALARAAAREGPGWMQWYSGRLARYGLISPAGDLAAAAAYLERERAVTLAAARQAGWSVITVGPATDVPPGQILRDARQQLSHLMHGYRPPAA